MSPTTASEHFTRWRRSTWWARRGRASSIDLGALRGPHGLDFKQGKVWFTAEVAKSIGSYDPASGKIDWIMGIGQDRTHLIYVFADGKRIVTTNVNSATVTILEKTGRQGGWTPPVRGFLPVRAGLRRECRRGLARGSMPIPPGGDWKLTVRSSGAAVRRGSMFPRMAKRHGVYANAQDGTVSGSD